MSKTTELKFISNQVSLVLANLTKCDDLGHDHLFYRGHGHGRVLYHVRVRVHVHGRGRAPVHGHDLDPCLGHDLYHGLLEAHEVRPTHHVHRTGEDAAHEVL